MWCKPDGIPMGKSGCDTYSRLSYLGRGLRPEVTVGGERMTDDAKVSSVGVHEWGGCL